jgi:hypothetical protein
MINFIIYFPNKLFILNLMNDATAITIFFRRQAEKSLGLLRIKLQKLTFCRNAINKNNIFLFVLYLFYGIGSLQSETFRFQEGDILFQEIKNSTSKAIKIVTNSRYTNVGVILKYRNKFIVLESNGIVKRTDLYQFLKRGVNGAYLVKRFKKSKEVLTEEAISKMREASIQFVGIPYDLYYGWGDEKLYSAELVWKFWKEALNLELCALKKYKDYDLSNPYVKLILSQKFGKDVPLEETAISPKDLLDSMHLETVFPRGTDEAMPEEESTVVPAPTPDPPNE